jgi:flagellar hook-associated protein 2
VVPGLVFNLVAPSTTPVKLTLASDSSQLSSGLQDFVSKYNALKTQLNAQVGSAGGLLTGDTAVAQLQNLTRQITSYTGASGTVKSLSDLGVEFSSTGQASFNATTFSALSSQQITDGFTFIGSQTSGLGKFAASLTQFSDPISGLIKVEQDGITRSDQNIQTQIATLNDRISAQQTTLQQQLALADTLAASLQSQQSTLTGSLQGLNLVLYGKAIGS